MAKPFENAGIYVAHHGDGTASITIQDRLDPTQEITLILDNADRVAFGEQLLNPAGSGFLRTMTPERLEEVQKGKPLPSDEDFHSPSQT